MKIKTLLTLFFIAFCATVFITNCGKTEVGSVTVDVSGKKLFPKLSDYKFFKGDLKDLVPNDGLVPYSLNSTLFTDYAHKQRFVYVPEGQSAEYKDEEAFDFPVGSVLIKNFYYPKDFRDESKGRQILETRLLIHEEDGWTALPYIWNEEQNDADLEVAGGKMDVSWIHYDGADRSVNYVVPNKNQCKGCHEYKGKFSPIGPKAKFLNGNYPYSDGEKNQLDKWKELGILKHCPSSDEAPRVAVWDDPSTGSLEERAKAYLDINCAHCHNAHGPANTSGLFLNTEIEDPTVYGIYKTPVAAGRGAGNFKYDVLPGQPGQSILLYRMASTDPGIMMPELGRKLVHAEGSSLIIEWINSLEGKYSSN